MFSYEFECYELAVKTEKSRAQPELISCYVCLGLELARRTGDVNNTRKMYRRIFSTLEETLCDSLVSASWKFECWKMIRKFFPLLHEVMNEVEYKETFKRLHTYRHYFLPPDQLKKVFSHDRS